MRLKQAVRVVTALAVVAGLWIVRPVAAVELDETSIPSSPRTSHLPAGFQAVKNEELCGSGGCYRELTLLWPGHSRAEIWTRLGVTGSQPAAADQVRIYVKWHRPIEL